jgi:hypothetical protein
MGLADGETNTIWLSKCTMGSRRAIADTLIHEELHFRLAARHGIPLGQQAAYEDWIAARDSNHHAEGLLTWYRDS